MTLLRLCCLLILMVLMALDIGPIPITDFLLIGIVLLRPAWFYRLVLGIYRNKDVDQAGPMQSRDHRSRP